MAGSRENCRKAILIFGWSAGPITRAGLSSKKAPWYSSDKKVGPRYISRLFSSGDGTDWLSLPANFNKTTIMIRGTCFLRLLPLLGGLAIPAFCVAQVPDWQNKDLQRDTVFGISTNKAYELVKGKKSHPVVVAVIDG